MVIRKKFEDNAFHIVWETHTHTHTDTVIQYPGHSQCFSFNYWNGTWNVYFQGLYIYNEA